MAGRPVNPIQVVLVSGTTSDGTPLEFRTDSEGRLKVALADSPTIDIGDVQVKNVAGDKINPATEAKQDALIADTAAIQAAVEALAAGRGSAATAAIEVGTSETTLATITPGTGVERITVDVANAAGGEALNSFKVYARAHEEADWVEHALTDAQVVEGYDTDLQTLAADSNAQLVLSARGWQAIKLTATTASGTADVTTRYTAA